MTLMRLDRWLTLWVFRALARTHARVPVLMYHSVSDDPEPGVKPYYRVATSPRRFAEQMDWLAARGYRGVALETALETVQRNQASERLVAITFDDGFRDFYTNAWPALRRHDFTATMYLPTAFIGTTRRSFRNKECLTWAEVRELRQAGIRFGSHTVNHPRLYDLSWPEIETELKQSRATLQDELNESITSFAYPFAFPQEDKQFTGRLRELLVAAGYDSCATTMVGRLGSGADWLRVKRLPANECDDQSFFTAKLAGAYDWFGSVQVGFRRLKQILGRSGRPVTLN